VRHLNPERNSVLGDPRAPRKSLAGDRCPGCVRGERAKYERQKRESGGRARRAKSSPATGADGGRAESASAHHYHDQHCEQGHGNREVCDDDERIQLHLHCHGAEERGHNDEQDCDQRWTEHAPATPDSRFAPVAPGSDRERQNRQ